MPSRASIRLPMKSCAACPSNRPALGVAGMRPRAYHREYVDDRAGKRIKGKMPARSSTRPPLGVLLAQWLTLASRCLAIKLKDHWNTAILLAQAPIIGGIIVMVWGRQVREEVTDVNYEVNVLGLAATLYMISFAGIWFGCSNAVREIVGEWAIYRRERMVNLKIVPYVASKFAVLSLLCVIQCMTLLGIVHWGCDLKGPWWLMFFIMLLASLFGIALSLVISAASKTSEMAIALVPVVLLPMMILGGMVQPLPKLDKATRFLCYGMASAWAFEGMLVLESDSRPLYRGRLPRSPLANKGPNAKPVTQRIDMAEPYFPTLGDDAMPYGWEISGTVLETLLIVLILSVVLILRARDVH